ncbi:MAG: aminoacyl-histidine dipeptidase [Clostridiales bacterium]|nr:aminoacyl-histidine dipeptidase [Clostridiales bacterium]
MKRFFILGISCVLVLTLFLSSCSLSVVDREKELKDALDTVYGNLNSTFSEETGEFNLITEYIKSWAKGSTIEITENSDHYMVLTNPATGGFENKESVTMQCSVLNDDFNNSMETLSIGLSALLGPNEHGNISLIITEQKTGERIGAAAVNPKYLQCDNFINLEYDTNNSLFTSGAKSLTGTAISSITTTAPKYTNAYLITMSIRDYTDPFNFSKHYPNPAETVGSLLASEKSSGKLFQIASFECEVSNGYTPHSAAAVVVVDENNVEGFMKKFDSSYENMENRFDKLDDSFVYTITETDMPTAVMSEDSSNNLISLMYTLKTGIFLQDEETEDIISVSNMSDISTQNNNLTVTIDGRSIYNSTLKLMSNAYLSTSTLCDMEYSLSNERDVWSFDKEKSLGAFFKKKMFIQSTEKNVLLKSCDLDILASKVSHLNAISYHCSMNCGESSVLMMTRFMESLAQ